MSSFAPVARRIEASEQTPVAYAFRVIARDGEGRFEEILGRSSDYAIAKAMFDAAVRQSPQQSVRLMKDFEVLEETGPRRGRSKWRPGNEIERSIFGA